MKKIASILLVLMLVLAMAVPALAETGSITVDNPKTGVTYTAYKIFDVKYNATKTAYSYTISGTSEWFDVVAITAGDGTVTSKITGLTFVKAASENTYVVEMEETVFSAAAFANTLKDNVTGKTGQTFTLDSETGKATVSNLPLGYYFVTSTSGALCNLTTTNPTVTIHDKNDIPFDKVDDKESVDVGEVVNYTITAKVPDYTGFTSYKYEITDKMSEGLTFNEDVKVYIGEVELTDTTKFSIDYSTEGKDFVLNIDVMKFTIGAEIKVTYTATVNDHAVAKVENNHAVLEYSNDPTDATKTGTMTDEETVYSAKVVIDKFVKDDEETKLAGAKFVLTKTVTTTEDGKEVEKTKYYKYTAATDSESAKVSWVDKLDDATVVTTDSTGAGSFDGLKNGTYYLLEIAAPDGYNLLAQPVAVEINGANATAVDTSSLTVTEGVANETGTVLPTTGGMGTTIFYVLGGLLIVAAGVALVTRRRMSK